jgi:hypothetical protein
MLIIIILAVYFVYYKPYYAPPRVVKYKYMENITAGFKIVDSTTGSLITSNVLAEIYPLGNNPFVKTFVNDSIATASYATQTAVLGACWTVIVDAGSYVLLVQDTATTKTKYPELLDVTVPGTNRTEREEWMDPSQVTMVQRATMTISTSILAYNSTSEAYDISVTNINVTTYTKWRIDITFSVAGDRKAFKPGYIYLSEITNLSPTKASLDGQTASVESDKDATDDSLTGYRIEYSDQWKGGEVHLLTVYLEKVASVSATTLTIQVADYYEVQNTDLKWWTYPSTSISVVT